MQRLLVAVITLALVLVAFAVPARAEHDEAGDFFEKKWPASVNRDFCIEPDFDERLNDNAWTNMKSTIVNSVNSVWEQDTQITTNWGLTDPDPECANDYEYENAGNCSAVLQLGAISRVSYDDESGGNGSSLRCDLDGNGNLDFFWVNINDCFHDEGCGLDFHFDYSTNVPSGDYDFAGTFIHEFGHATGFNGHFDPNSTACPDSSWSSDMCSGADWDPATHATGGFCGCAWRTLSAHDIGAINEVYP